MAKRKPTNVVPLVDKNTAALKYLQNLCKDGKGAVVLAIYLEGQEHFIWHNINDFKKGFRHEVARDLMNTAESIMSAIDG